MGSLYKLKSTEQTQVIKVIRRQSWPQRLRGRFSRRGRKLQAHFAPPMRNEGWIPRAESTTQNSPNPSLIPNVPPLGPCPSQGPTGPVTPSPPWMNPWVKQEGVVLSSTFLCICSPTWTKELVSKSPKDPVLALLPRWHQAQGRAHSRHPRSTSLRGLYLKISP